MNIDDFKKKIAKVEEDEQVYTDQISQSENEIKQFDQSRN